ncbi:MAG: four helix bundle protein [Verrucomicrobia bacterium]|nr:four helix bundle protein [Verrucomicrobiota bacterium]
MPNDQTPPGQQEPWENEAKNRYPEHGDSPLELREGESASANVALSGEPDYDLEERTAKFGEAVIRFVKKMPDNSTNCRLISQLVGCGTSIGASYCEADDAVSKKEFLNKIGTCKKEAKETKFFLRMASTAEPGLKEEARSLWREARELHLIFCKIYRSGRGQE